jgi:chemotaxis protein MotB
VSLVRRKPRQEGAPGAPAWLLTYGDLVTQLLIFFVLLFSMSVVDVQKFEAALMSLQGALGFLDSPVVPKPDVPPIQPPSGVDQPDYYQMLEIQDVLTKELSENNLQTAVTLNLEERGLVVRFADNVLFDMGSAEIKPEGRVTLDKVGGILKGIPNHLRIEGHTDDLPIKTASFPSNWELSTARATNVVRYLVDMLGLNANRLSAAGYGEYRPVVPNDTPENRKLNRRVDILVLYETKTRLEPR